MAQGLALGERAGAGELTRAPGPGAPARRAGVAAPRRSRLRRHGAGILVGLVGAALTAGVVVATVTINHRTEHRLLVNQTRQGAAVLQLDTTTLEHPLAAAAELAATDPTDFRRFASSVVGGGERTTPYASLSLWRRRDGRFGPVTVVGAPLHLGARTPGIQHMLTTAGRERTLGVLGFLTRRPPEIVYGFVAVAGGGRVAVVGTEPLRSGRVGHRKAGSAFSELNYAIYLGRHPAPSRLLFRTTAHPLGTERASAVVPFGDRSITLVTAPVGWLAGPIAQWLPWGLLAAGVILAAVAGLMTDRLVGRRRQAETLALEVTRLYGEQRTIAENLQQALLPDVPPEVPGLELAMRYVAGATGVDVGGDWYDVVPFGDRRVLAVVGDVSGRGVDAARVMAALRHAVRAYAAEAGTLEELVGKLAGLLDVGRDGHFATLLTMAIDVEGRACQIVNAGHLAPLVVDGQAAAYLPTAVAPPIGVPAARYEATLHAIPPGATLLAFTDGLVERRSAGIDPGLEDLRALAVGGGANLQAFVDHLTASLCPTGSDDAAVLALRWRR